LTSGSLAAVNTPNQGDLIAAQFGGSRFATNGGKLDGSDPIHPPTVGE